MARAVSALRRIDRNPAVVGAVHRLRRHLPGDHHFGDPLSIADRPQLARLQQQLALLTGSEDGAARELTGAVLQVWQAVLAARGRETGAVEVTLLFTDLVGFSDWALTAGDEQTLELLRAVGHAVEPPVATHGGQVVKRLGDGMMAAFPHPQAAFDAVVEARQRLAGIPPPDRRWRPRLRTGLHTGRPRRLGGDYLGVDVNIAARLAERAGPGEILASATAVAGLDPQRVRWRRKKTFALLRVKGVPGELEVYALTPTP